MHIKSLFILPFMSGCLLNFSPFEEESFLEDYESTLCTTYLDCLDGEADGTVTSDQEALNDYCEEYVRTPQREGCQILSDRAASCYDEMTTLVSRIQNENACTLLTENNSLPSCRVTYLDCATDAPFGSVPSTAPSTSPPSVDFIDVLHGPTSGGNTITFTGRGFDAETRVQFAGEWGEVVSVNTTGTIAKVTLPPRYAGTANINIVNSVGNIILEDQLYTYWEDLQQSDTGLLTILDYSRDVGGYWSDTETSSASAFFWEFTTAPQTQSPIEWYEYLGFSSPNVCVINGSQTGVSGSPIETSYTELRIVSETNASFNIPQSSGGDGWLPSFDTTGLPALQPGKSYTLETDYAEGWPALSIPGLFTAPRAITLSNPDIATPKSEIPIWDLNDPLVWNQSATNDDYVYVSLQTEKGDEVSCTTQDSGLLFIENEFQSTIANQQIVITACRLNRTNASPSIPINNGWASTLVRYCVRGMAVSQLR